MAQSTKEPVVDRHLDNNWFHQAMEGGNTSLQFPHLNKSQWTLLDVEILNTFKSVYAAATWRATKAAWLQLRAFRRTHASHLRRTLSQQDIIRFLQYRLSHPCVRGRKKRFLSQTSPRSVVALASCLIRICRHLEIPTEQIKAFTKGIRKRYAAARSIRRALPLSRQMALQLIAITPMSFKAGIWLAWKTASRWADVMTLRAKHLQLIRVPERRKKLMLLVTFPTSKANPEGSPRADHIVLISDSKGIPPFVQEAARQSPEEFVIKARRAMVQAFLRAAQIRPEYHQQFRRPGVIFNKKLSLHSIKMGAVDCLWQAAANGILSPQQVTTLSKHMNSLALEIPAYATGYCPRPYLLALAHGTDVSTQCLDLDPKSSKEARGRV